VVLDRQRAAPQHRGGLKFDRFPTLWTDRLLGCNSVAAWAVAALLLRKQFTDHRQTIRLANTRLEQKQKWRGLRELENLGLVKIVPRGVGKSPDVTLLHT
jgi:hypothetical protein